jgi:hypothetical protein
MSVSSRVATNIPLGNQMVGKLAPWNEISPEKRAAAKNATANTVARNQSRVVRGLSLSSIPDSQQPHKMGEKSHV